MTDQVATYPGALNNEGYEWARPSDRKGRAPRIRPPWNAQGENTPRLMLVGKRPERLNRRSVFPIHEDSALFRNFAAMDPTPDEIINFVSRFGTLWDADGEPFAEWEYEVRTMRFLIDIWDEVKAGRLTERFARHFARDNAPVVKYPYVDTVIRYEPFLWKRALIREHMAKGATVLADHYSVGGSGKPHQEARKYLVQAVNMRLSKLEPQTALDWVDGKYRLVTCPRNLIGALWLQFALSISGNKSYRPCEVCSRSMEMSPDVNRADRRYCSDACRSRALRRRQKTAREMRASGKSLREIAKVTGSDMNTIKKWIASQED